LKMEPTQGSETSAYQNLTPGRYPKEYTQYSTHGESLKSRFIPSKLTISSHKFSDQNFVYITHFIVGFIYPTYFNRGHAVAHLVEALRYKPEGREIDYR
jgi:hypothetical protein